MAAQPKTLSELNTNSVQYLLEATDGRLSLLTPGSTARALVEASNRHIADMYSTLSLHKAMTYVSTAAGVYLDLIAELFGMARRPAVKSEVTREDRAIRFYVSSGTLFDKLPRSDLSHGIIPTGTSVSSTDGSVIYTTTADVLVHRTAREVFAPARATVAGTGHNVGAFTLRNHSLGVDGVMVTNTISIASGREIETDEEFRARIVARVRTEEGANEASIRLAALSAPGVSDVRIVPYLAGAGSFDVLLVPTGNRVTTAAFEIARQNVAATAAFGIYWRLREPKYVRVSMVISLSFKPGILAGEGDTIRRNVERAVLNHLGSIRIGGELIISALGPAIFNSDSRVKDYDIQALCIDGKPQLLHNYQLEQDELFLADEGLSDPIRVV